ncbi:RNA polymerase sigma-70 factor, ECF subfamily [Fodinibius salinus]|uniref:RNA polymerase sigma-70 factor, ECF subfamily n=1 Tax=Fodinibius salinus TaxID=860790 RepID=A0A5D3YJF0_9BACT|nr:sigma-70 family RNA polymerase sigma factor [Fodinibius salinus]TYP92576.1 RNA polymerase sigma-70 factor, ECF subfamily [Fodinibius salinus]
MILFTLLATIGKITHGNSDDEIELMKRIQARDEEAIEELYNLYNKLLFGMVISIVKKREEAEDVLQEIFVKIWNKADQFKPDRGNVYSWIVTLARNTAIDRIRSKGYKTQQKQSVSIHQPLFSLEGDKHDPMETTIFSDRAELVQKALDKIPEKQSKVIKIAYYRGMTQREISDHLDIPLGTVKTRTRQGMIKLKRILEEHISTDG